MANKKTQPHRWTRRVMETSNALDLEPKAVAKNDPKSIARSLKRSAAHSDHRKSDLFRSGMSILTFYINRAGQKLPAQRLQRLEAAKDELRALYGKPGQDPKSNTVPRPQALRKAKIEHTMTMQHAGNPRRSARSLLGLRWPALAAAVLCMLLTMLLPACDIRGSGLPFTTPSSRVLFIGNSFTFYNAGVDQELKGLDPSIEVDRLAVGGYTLRNHWDGGQALDDIRQHKWNYVVLQEQSQTPVTDQADFAEYAGRFSTAVKDSGAEPILFMTWERPDSVRYGVTTQNLANAYFDAGDAFGAKVAPVGLAFASALLERPQLSLYAEDGHPTPPGSYLSACVLYATIFGKTPVGLGYAPPGVSQADRDFLQRIAAGATGY